MTVDNEFSLKNYQKIILDLQTLGYKARTFGELNAGERHMVLRHDVDMSLSAALTIAQAEAELEVSSIFFVLMRSEFYNPWTPKSLGLLNEIEKLGHSIGLHLDASLYEDDKLEEGAAIEILRLENLLSHPVELISFHRPAKRMIGSDDMIAGRAHTYQTRFVEDIGYCADSRGVWQYGHPLEHDAVKNGRALQLLTHPIWWAMTGADPQAKLDSFLDRWQVNMDEELSRQCAAHASTQERITGKRRK